MNWIEWQTDAALVGGDEKSGLFVEIVVNSEWDQHWSHQQGSEMMTKPRKNPWYSRQDKQLGKIATDSLQWKRLSRSFLILLENYDVQAMEFLKRNNNEGDLDMGAGSEIEAA